MPFTYLASHEALNASNSATPGWVPRTRPIHVFDLPFTLQFGLHPLGWHYLGHDRPGSSGVKDYWRAPGNFRDRYTLTLPRDLDADTITLKLRDLDADTTLWTVTVTTRAELDAELISLTSLIADPEAFRVFAALHGAGE